MSLVETGFVTAISESLMFAQGPENSVSAAVSRNLESNWTI